jgi:hypothetical protein
MRSERVAWRIIATLCGFMPPFRERRHTNQGTAHAPRHHWCGGNIMQLMGNNWLWHPDATGRPHHTMDSSVLHLWDLHDGWLEIMK